MSADDLRIGDAERERAVSLLADHYAAGRLTREELDERSESAWRARTHAELEPLFRDLPLPQVPAPSRSPAARPAGRGVRPFVLPVPLLLVLALVALVAVTRMPWLLFAVFWIACWGGFGRARHRC